MCKSFLGIHIRNQILGLSGMHNFTRYCHIVLKVVVLLLALYRSTFSRHPILCQSDGWFKKAAHGSDLQFQDYWWGKEQLVFISQLDFFCLFYLPCSFPPYFGIIPLWNQRPLKKKCNRYLIYFPHWTDRGWSPDGVVACSGLCGKTGQRRSLG